MTPAMRSETAGMRNITRLSVRGVHQATPVPAVAIHPFQSRSAVGRDRAGGKERIDSKGFNVGCYKSGNGRPRRVGIESCRQSSSQHLAQPGGCVHVHLVYNGLASLVLYPKCCSGPQRTLDLLLLGPAARKSDILSHSDSLRPKPLCIQFSGESQLGRWQAYQEGM